MNIHSDICNIYKWMTVLIVSINQFFCVYKIFLCRALKAPNIYTINLRSFKWTHKKCKNISVTSYICVRLTDAIQYSVNIFNRVDFWYSDRVRNLISNKMPITLMKFPYVVQVV